MTKKETPKPPQSVNFTVKIKSEKFNKDGKLNHQIKIDLKKNEPKEV